MILVLGSCSVVFWVFKWLQSSNVIHMLCYGGLGVSIWTFVSQIGPLYSFQGLRCWRIWNVFFLEGVRGSPGTVFIIFSVPLGTVANVFCLLVVIVYVWSACRGCPFTALQCPIIPALVLTTYRWSSWWWSVSSSPGCGHPLFGWWVLLDLVLLWLWFWSLL